MLHKYDVVNASPCPLKCHLNSSNPSTISDTSTTKVKVTGVQIQFKRNEDVDNEKGRVKVNLLT